MHTICQEVELKTCSELELNFIVCVYLNTYRSVVVVTFSNKKINLQTINNSAAALLWKSKTRHDCFYAIYSTFSVLFPVLELCPPLHPLKPSGACGQELYPPLLAFKAPLHSGTPQRTCGRSPATSAIWKIQVRNKKRKKKESFISSANKPNK